MANVHVDYEQVQSAYTRLSAGQQETDALLKRLKAQIDNLVASGFVTDVASGKFHQSYQQWNTGATNVMAGLEGMSSFLKTVIEQHRQLDSQLGQASGG